MDPILNELNPAQKCAVTSPASILQVLAPPGSGKTKTLTARVAHQISYRNVHPCNMIVCTFTIKAAREMKERIHGLIGKGLQSELILGTFHSVARRFLVWYGQKIGIPAGFGIADKEDSKAILKRIVKRRRSNCEAPALSSRISGLKARSIGPDEYKTTHKQTEQQEFASIYAEYEETLRSSNLLDYDDLLLRCADLLHRHPECVLNVEAVLIDEFQDTNHVQFRLMQLFSQHCDNITIVGDPDQSIYGFRFAEIKNLARMKELYPRHLVVNLEENYRSSGAILDSAIEVIEQDTSRPGKKPRATLCRGERPVLRKLPNAQIEASWLVSEIQRSKALTGHLLEDDDFAILLRSAALSRRIESALGSAGIPYRMVGGLKFFDRVEVKLILDYLRVVGQHEHNNAVARVLNVPSRRIGDPTIKSLLEEAEAKQSSLWQLLLDAAQGRARPKTVISSQAQKGIDSFVDVILSAKNKLSANEGGQCPVVDLIAFIIKKISFKEYLNQKYADDVENRWANIQELVSQAADSSVASLEDKSSDEFLPVIDGVEQRDSSEVENALTKFLANIALSSEVQKGQDEEDRRRVTVSTIHAAKGLEWPVVFIPGAYDGSIPHSRAEDNDEERRLLYVGMTRAQCLLYLSCPSKNSTSDDTTLSTFLLDLDGSPFFDNKGPIFDYSVTQDLARILRRPCPAEPFTRECWHEVPSMEDNFWTLDGKERDYNVTQVDWTTGRRILPEDFSGKKRKVEFKAVSTTLHRTSMNSDEHSVSTSTMKPAFISAGARMQELAVEQRDCSKPTTTNTTSNKKPKTQSASQGNLLSFFAKRSASTIQAKHPFLAKPTGLARDPHSFGITVTSKAREVAPRQAHSTTIAKRKIRTGPISSRPLTVRYDEALTKSHEIRRSSSSLQSDQVGDQQDINVAGTSTSSISMSDTLNGAVGKIDRSESQECPASAINGFRPASTLHETSVTRATTTSVSSQRRTLGVRRNLQPWSAQPGGRKT